MYRHISHFFLFHQINGVPHSLLRWSWLFGQENLSHVIVDNPEKAGQIGHVNLRQSSLSFSPNSSASSSDAHFVLRHAGSIHEQVDGQKQEKKAFRFTTSYTSESPKSQVGVQLFLVGLNLRSANMRGGHSTSDGNGRTCMHESITRSQMA